jgi:hypothetical protein
LILGLLKIDCLEYIRNEHIIYNELDSQARAGMVLCPVCGGFVCMHGTYKRKVIISEFDTKTVTIIQVRCKECRKVHAVLPGFIAPNKQYDLNLIKEAVEKEKNKLETCAADDSTIRRWRISLK